MCSCSSSISTAVADDASLLEIPQDISSLEVHAAHAACLAYGNLEEISQALPEVQHLSFHEVENAFAVSWLKNRVLTFAFRGTELEDWQDLFDDLDFIPCPLYWAKSFHAHAGFSRHFNKLQSSLLASILILPMHYVEQVVFAGHSLGGATAYLAGFFFQDTLRALGYQGVVEVRTFGSPRIGSEGLKNWCAEKDSMVHVVAYENSSDGIPKVPPEFSENFAQSLIIFKSHELPVKAHSMKGYLRDVRLLENLK